ncbi:MAG: hypothetical protein RL497_577 [Pseudomonadota bacterium]|jgi:tetratricopeptide (TPR) repeat protein
MPDFFLRRSIGCIGLVFSLLACAHRPPVAAPAAPPPPVLAPAPREYNAFAPETFYSLLVAEMAGNRNRLDVMLSNYQQQAHATRDPEVVARACRLARFVNLREAALSLCSLWVDVSPNLVEARQALLAESLQANQLKAAFVQAEFLAAQGEESGLDVLAARAVQQSVTDAQRVEELLPLYQQLAARYPAKTDVLLGTSYLLQRQNQLEAALEMARKGLAQKSDDFGLISQESRLLLALNRTDEANARIKRLLELQPNNQRLRLHYAKSLATHNLPEAQQQLAILLREAPEDGDLNLAQALVLLEQNKLSEAEPLLAKLTQTRHASSAQYYLGRIYNQQGDYSRAVEALTAVPPGPDYLPALGQLIAALQKSGRSEEALVALDKASAQMQLADEKKAPLDKPRAQMPPQARSNITLLKANLLADMNRSDEAVRLLSEALSTQPNASDLLYGRALLYGRLGKDAEAEADLRTILLATPQHAATLNALGYGISKNPQRLREAEGYVQQALTLAPNEPSIIDSLGWIYLQQGKIGAALKLLKQAYSLLPDPEIGAHLGEALWLKGEKNEAKTLWRQIQKQAPQSEPLLNTLKRLNISLD